MTEEVAPAAPEWAVAFPSGRDVRTWELDHDEGLRPDRWPYGLDGLTAFAPTSPVNLGPGGRGRRVGNTVRRQLGGQGPDVCLTWEENAAREARIQLSAHRRFTGVIWATDVIARDGVRSHRRLRSTLRAMDGLWVLSEAQADPLREALGRGAPPIEYLPFGIDAEFFRPTLYPDRPLILSVGTDRDRDAATLFAALERVRLRVPDAEIIVQSPADVREPAGVTRVGHMPHTQLRELYSRATVVAVATRPNLHVSGMTVGLETMASARPLVITETPGMRDYFGSGEACLLTPPSDPIALAAAILALVDDPVRAQLMGLRGRRLVEHRFTSERFVSDLARFIRRPRRADRSTSSHGTT